MNRLNNKDQIFKVAIYLRLSKDDGDLSVSENGKAESNSIHNQRELLHNFLKQHPELELYDEYKEMDGQEPILTVRDSTVCWRIFVRGK